MRLRVYHLINFRVESLQTDFPYLRIKKVTIQLYAKNYMYYVNINIMYFVHFYYYTKLEYFILYFNMLYTVVDSGGTGGILLPQNGKI